MAILHGGFGALPAECLLAIAERSAPPDVYNLYLTSRRFHEPAVAGAREAVCGGESKRRKTERPVLASLLLRASLIAQLRRVLPESLGQGSFSPEALKNFPPGSVLLSGSVMVRSCLGDSWDCSDVDLYCTAAAAPAVRSMLVKEGDFVLTGFRPGYKTGSQEIEYSIEAGPRIHRVERFHRTPTPEVDPGFNFEEAVREGEVINEEYVGLFNGPFVGSGSESFGSNAIYRVRPLPGDQLPFYYRPLSDLELGPALDLIVAADGCTDVGQLMGNFDLPICASTWDGVKLNIVNPHLTFNRQTRMEPGRRDLMRDYMRHYNASVISTDYALPDLQPHSIRLIKKAVGRLSSEQSYHLVFTNEMRTKALMFETLKENETMGVGQA